MLDSIIDGFRLSRVLMDGGSGVNIIFPDTLAKMEISKSHLRPSPTGFHGFVPGNKVKPLGQISLEVVFRNKENLCFKTLWFEAAPFRTVYNALLGRPAYVKFMALPSYVYLLLKIPHPNGTITIYGSAKRALEVEVAKRELAEAALASVELKEIKKSVDPSTRPLARKSKWGPAFPPAKETKKFQVQLEGPTKTQEEI